MQQAAGDGQFLLHSARQLRGKRRPFLEQLELVVECTKRQVGPQVSDATIREAFSQRWVLEDLRLTEYRGAIVRDEHAVALHRQIGEFVDLPAWLARARRI